MSLGVCVKDSVFRVKSSVMLLITLVAVLFMALPILPSVNAGVVRQVEAWDQDNTGVPGSCLATSYAIISNYFGSGKDLQQSMRLLIDNGYVNATNGYVNYDALRCCQLLGSTVTKVSFGSDPAAIPGLLDDANCLVEAWCNAAPGRSEHHWVVVGYEGTTLKIMDPIDGELKDNLYPIDGYRIFRGTHVGSTTVTSGSPGAAAPATAFVFDVSDSMSEWSVSQTKIEEARSAGLDVVDSIGNLAASSGTAAQVAISSFSSTATRVQDLTADYATVRQRIGELEPLEMTNLGAGLEAGLDQLDAAPGGAAKTIVLLSDGMSNEGMSPDEILAGPVQRAKDSGVKIYTVGFGDPSTTSGYSGLDEDLLNQIANDTGGVYARADTSKARTSLSSLFIHSQVASTQKVLAEFEGTVAQGSLAAAGSFGVAPADSLVQVVLNWPGSQLDLQLTDPAGMAVATGYPGYTLYPGRPAQAVIKNPAAGQWKLAVYGAEVTGTEEPYYALVSSQSAVPGIPTGAGVSGAPAGSATAWLWLIAVPALAVIGWLTWSQRRLRPRLATQEKPAGIEAMADFANASVTGGQGRLALVAEDGTRFELKHGSNPVGRSSENAIQLDDARASRSHAVIVSGADQVLVRDLGSAGGTLVNGDTVEGERVLRDGDRLSFGESTFVFRST